MVFYLVIMTWITVVNNISFCVNKGHTQVFQNMFVDITADYFAIKGLLFQLFVESAVVILQFCIQQFYFIFPFTLILVRNKTNGKYQKE